jgi:hypothetical protein
MLLIYVQYVSVLVMMCTRAHYTILLSNAWTHLYHQVIVKIYSDSAEKECHDIQKLIIQ